MVCYHIVYADGHMDTVAKNRARAIAMAQRAHADHVLCTVSLSHPPIRIWPEPPATSAMMGTWTPVGGVSQDD